MPKVRRAFHNLSATGEYKPGQPNDDDGDSDEGNEFLSEYPNPEFYPKRFLESSPGFREKLGFTGPPGPPDSLQGVKSPGNGHPEKQSGPANAGPQSNGPRTQQATSKSTPPRPTGAAPSVLAVGGHAREAIPTVPEERLNAQLAVHNGEFRTFEQALPPPSDAQYLVADQGISGPDHLRLSMYNIPASSQLRERTKLPLGALVRPFAQPEVPTAVFTGHEPVRCRRCRTYINPGVTWTKGGAMFTCNLCKHSNTTPDWYYQPTGADGRRIDWQERPELIAGTYEFVLADGKTKFNKGDEENDADASDFANTSYNYDYAAQSVPDEDRVDASERFGGSGESLRQVFIIDVTRDSLNKGIPKQAANAIRHALYGEQNVPNGGSIPPETKVGFLTFARSVHAYQLGGRAVNMLVYPDLDAIDLPPDLFIDPAAHFDNVSSFLDNVMDYFVEKWEAKSSFGSALSVALDALAPAGGRVSAIMATLPSVGPGELAHRDRDVYGVNVGPGSTLVPLKELYISTSKFYSDLAIKYAKQGVACDLFAFPTGYVDLANVGHVCEVTGGFHRVYPRFVATRDARSFIADVLQATGQEVTATECQVKVRTSMGLQTEAYWGLGSPDGLSGAMDCSTTFAVTFVHDARLNPSDDVHVQSAVLYTDRFGVRKVRISNVPAGVADRFKSVMKFVDTDTVLAIMARQALAKLPEEKQEDIRHGVANKCYDIFGAARLNASDGMPPGQLLMPVTYRQLPALVNGLVKSVPIGARVYTSDSRMHAARIMKRMTADELALYLYPRIYAINEDFASVAATESIATDNEIDTEFLEVGTLRAKSSDVLNGAYLFFNGQMLFLYVTAPAAPKLLEDLFGVLTMEDVPPYMDELPELDTALNQRTRRLCTHLAHRVGRAWLPLQIARQEHDGAEYSIYSMLVEDAHDIWTYTDFVATIHQHVKRYTEEDKTRWL